MSLISELLESADKVNRAIDAITPIAPNPANKKFMIPNTVTEVGRRIRSGPFQLY